jgi:hypothetical protein
MYAERKRRGWRLQLESVDKRWASSFDWCMDDETHNDLYE